MGRAIKGLTGGGERARTEPWTDAGVPRDVFETASAQAEQVGASQGMLAGFFQSVKHDMGSRFNPNHSSAWSAFQDFT